MNESADIRAAWRASSVADDLSFLLARSNALSLSASNAVLRQFGLKVRSYPVLALACDDLRPTQRELADFLRLDPSQVVALIDDLEREGWVERQISVRDRRSKELVATAAGRTICAAAREAVRAAEMKPFAALDTHELATLTELLSRVAFPDSTDSGREET